MADQQNPATSPSTSSKKKRHKKRKHVNVTFDASSTGGAGTVDGEPVDVSIDASTGGAGTVDVTIDASFTGAASSSSAAPVVAYFPTGYDPITADEPPGARLLRHEKHPSRIELVVNAPRGGPDFVGRSYTGEAATPQLCGYALGFLDKASGTLKVIPIAANKILRMEPHFEVQQPAHSKHSGAAAEAGSSATSAELKMQDLTQAFGAKKDKDKDNKWRSLKQQRDDPSAYLNLDLGKSETNVDATESQASLIVRNIPPYDPAADTSEKAYLFDEIIPKNVRPHLLYILEHVETGEFSSKGYGTFVSNRVNKLEGLQGGDKKRLAWILSYITHLLTLLERNSSMSKKHRKEDHAAHGPLIPQAVFRKLLLMFTEPGSSALSIEKHELLINYILVLTLFADDFSSDPADISKDLKMNRGMIKPYYDQLGCKSVSAGAFKPSMMTLPAPLKFPQEVRTKRRR